HQLPSTKYRVLHQNEKRCRPAAMIVGVPGVTCAIIGAMKLTTLLAVVSIGALAPASVSAQPQPQGPPPPCVDAAGIQFVCGQQGPEDLVVVPGGAWVVASALAGSGGINVIRVSDRMSTKVYPSASARDQLDAKTYDKCPGPPDASKFTSHG